MIRNVLIILICIVMLPVLGYAAWFWRHNLEVEPPAQAELQEALEAAIQWTDTNADRLLNANNPMLWRMLQQSARLTGDGRLQNLFARYEQRYLAGNQHDPWLPLFRERAWVPVTAASIQGLPYYNRHFVYSLTCDEGLWALPDIRDQNRAGFCDAQPLRTACVTHQLMGLRLQQRKQCRHDPGLADTVAHLQERLVGQLSRDPRPVDVYLQRLLMLTESGAGSRIKPVWLRRLLRAQLPEGAWTDTPALLPLPGARDLVLTRNGLGFRRPSGSFHTTAQGIHLLSLMLYGQAGDGRL